MSTIFYLRLFFLSLLNRMESSYKSYNKDFANHVANLCIQKYNKLPKSGKPNLNESQWTLLSGICVEKDGHLNVIALATGTKCMGFTSYSKKGDVLLDSHAEVLARRAFLRYLYSQMNETIKTNKSHIFEAHGKENFTLKDNVKFHFFTSHTPCGDASIFPRKIKQSELTKIQNTAKRIKLEKDFLKKRKNNQKCIVDLINSDDSSDSDTSLSGDVGSMVDDFHRTGARCLPDESIQDLRASGSEYHVTGVVRTKPGRGDPTYSMSCSDKIAKWNVVGWQGALVSMLVENAIPMTTITVGGGIAFSMEALERALVSRIVQLIPPTAHPILLHSDVIFQSGKRVVKSKMKKMGRFISSAHPVGASLIWCDVPYKPLEVSIGGIKHGVARKKHNLDNKNSTVLVSTYKLLLQFIQITGKNEYLNKPYEKIKLGAGKYQEQWQLCKTALGRWLEIPTEFRQFSVLDMNEKL